MRICYFQLLQSILNGKKNQKKKGEAKILE